MWPRITSSGCSPRRACSTTTDLVFKGGTSLRKCRLGGAGRFSTDLDFAAPNDDTVLAVCEIVDGAAVSGFRFFLTATRGDGRHWNLTVDHPDLGRPAIGASIEYARRPLILTPERLPTISLYIHKAYGITLPTLPVIAEAEACAEKLARYRRTALGRDVYDLAQFAGRPIDERLVRRLWVLKVWADVVDDGRGSGPLDPHDVLVSRGGSVANSVQDRLTLLPGTGIETPSQEPTGQDRCSAVHGRTTLAARSPPPGGSPARRSSPTGSVKEGRRPPLRPAKPPAGRRAAPASLPGGDPTVRRATTQQLIELSGCTGGLGSKDGSGSGTAVGCSRPRATRRSRERTVARATRPRSTSSRAWPARPRGGR